MEREEKIVLATVGIAGVAGLGYVLYKYLKPILPADFALSALVIDPTSVYLGDTVTIEVTATNLGEEAGSKSITMEVMDMAQTKTVSLQPGESKQVMFSVTASQLGVQTVSVDGLAGSFETIELPAADFIVSNLIIFPTQVYIGETVSVSVTVTNIGQSAGSCTIVMEVT